MSFQLLIDWDNEGFDTGSSYQDVTEYVIDVSTRRGFSAFDLMEDEPDMSVTLNNSDRRFTPRFQGSDDVVTSATYGYSAAPTTLYGGHYTPLVYTEGEAAPYFGKLTANKPIRLLFDGVALWSGYTHVWQPEPLRYGKRLCRLTCRGIVWRLKKKRILVQNYTNVTADKIIGDAVVAAGVPLNAGTLWAVGTPGFSEIGVTTYLNDSTNVGNFDVGESLIERFGFNSKGRDEDSDTTAASVIKDALAHERGRLFTLADGTLRFLKRNAWTVNTSVDWSSESENAATAFMDIRYFSGTEDLANAFTVQGYQAVVETSTNDVLFELSNFVDVLPGREREITTFIKNDAGNVIAADSILPIDPDDVEWRGGRAGSLNVSARAQTLIIRITNGKTLPVRLTALIVRGQRINYDSFKVSARDEASIADLQEQEESITIKSMQSISEANDIANFELGRRLDLTNGYFDDVMYQRGFDELTAGDKLITSDIGTRVRLIDEQVSHNRKYRITRVSHDISAERREYRVTYGLEYAYRGDVWQIGISRLNEDTVLGY